MATSQTKRPAIPLHLLAVLAAFASLAIAGISLAAPAEPARAKDAPQPGIHLDLGMDVRLGGLKFGSIAMQAQFNDDAYTARSIVRTEGITDHVFRQVFDLTSSGARTDTLMQTSRYKAENTDQDDIQLIDVSYGETGTPLVAADPPYDNSGRVQPSAADLRNTIDPLSAMIIPGTTATREICNRKIPVYDGRRRYDFEMQFVGMSAIEGKNGFSGPAVRCDAKLVPLAGYTRDTINEIRREPTPIRVWLGAVPDAGALVPVRLEVLTPLGTLVARAHKFTVSTAPHSQAAMITQ